MLKEAAMALFIGASLAHATLDERGNAVLGGATGVAVGHEAGGRDGAIVILAAVLGEMELFKTTRFGKSSICDAHRGRLCALGADARGPVMNKPWMPAYDWLLIGGIILSAAWLVALFTGSLTLEPLFGSARAGRRREHVGQRAWLLSGFDGGARFDGPPSPA